MKVQACSMQTPIIRRTHRVIDFATSLVLILLLSLAGQVVMAQILDPTLPPSGNFDLSYWKLTRPNNQEIDEDNLSNGYQKAGEFYTDSITGAMVFWCPNDGRTTSGSTYPRNEFREMIRRGDNSIGTSGINGNNWVFSSSTMENQEAAGGVDGVMTATLTVDHVSETSDETRKIGRVIVGQIHASSDEPCRLYYRKLPGHERGSIYFAHEPTTGAEQWYDMIGSRSDGAADPEDGIALGELFSYEIKVVENALTVTIMREGKPDVVTEIDMSDSGFEDDWMYFKAGVYNQNNAGDADEYVQASFYALEVTHFAPTPPTGYDAPSDIPRFQSFLGECKLQGPTSSTLRDVDALNDGYSHPEWFKVVDGDKILFNQTGDSKRTELRDLENWDLTQADRSLHGRIDIVEQTCDQVTVMQIHDDANVGSGPNKPLLRIYKHNAKTPANNIWAAIKTNEGGIATMHVPLGEDPGGYFNCDIRLVDGNMIIDYQGEEKVNMDVSFWTWPSYWKAGVYLQDEGEATAYFDELFEEDGTQQNYFPSVSISSPSNGENFEPGSDITIMVDADDSDGAVAVVEFYEGANKLGEDAEAPYSYTWVGPADGQYNLTAKATDNEGGARTSLSTRITVSNQVNVTGVSFIGGDGPVAVGGTARLNASVNPANATNQNVTYTSDDTSIATIDENGIVTGLTEGVVTLSVTTDEGALTDSRVVDILLPSTETNWAIDQSVEGSGTADGDNVSSNLVDDDADTRWSVEEFPQSATIDLGTEVVISRTEVTSYQDRAYQFTIEAALNEGGPYSTIVDRSSNTSPGLPDAPIINLVDSIEARYVKVTVTGADLYTGPWVSLTEVRIFGLNRSVNVNEQSFAEISISPNPATSVVMIDGADLFHTVSIYDQVGRLVIREQNDSISSLDVSDLQAGVYVIRLEGVKRSYSSKLIKQ